MYKVSVIVPVYGTEQYIERCARSLFEQTLDDIEYIFVNDCTPDASIEILEDVINRYPNRKLHVHIINHNENKGLPSARQTGVYEAQGEYIAHCDSDDWVDVDMYRTLYEVAKSGNHDYVKCSHIITDGNGHNKIIVPLHKSVNVSKKQVISDLLLCKGWNSVWDTIVKRTLYTEDVKFAPYTMLEDFFLSTQLLIKAKSIYCIEKPLYYYYQNSNSICGRKDVSSYLKRVVQAKENILLIEGFIKDEYGSTLYKKELVSLKYIAYKLLYPIMNSNYYNYWNNLFPELKKQIFFSPYLSKLDKLKFYLVEFHLFEIFRKCL